MTSLLVGSKSFSFKHKNFQKQTTSFSAEDFPFHVCLWLTTIRVTVVHPFPKPLQVTLNYIAQKTAIHTLKQSSFFYYSGLQTSIFNLPKTPPFNFQTYPTSLGSSTSVESLFGSHLFIWEYEPNLTQCRSLVMRAEICKTQWMQENKLEAETSW